MKLGNFAGKFLAAGMIFHGKHNGGCYAFAVPFLRR
jgi:hypothetical protein